MQQAQRSTWYIYEVPPQKEFVAEVILGREGYKTAVPSECVLRRKNRYSKAKCEVKYPAMRGYVFVEVPEKIPWNHIFRYRIVRSIVGMGGVPTPIPASAIGRLMEMSGRAFPHKSSTNTRQSFTAGDEVVIASGPLAGVGGRVEMIRGRQATMVMEMLGVPRHVSVPLESLEAA